MKKDIDKMTDYELATHFAKEKYKQLMSEPFQVVIKLPSQSNMIRITYQSKSKKKVLEIEELKDMDTPIASCIFKGKKAYGNLDQSIIDLKSIFEIKPTDWLTYNTNVWIDEFFKQN
jgi:hypothetical protein